MKKEKAIELLGGLYVPQENGEGGLAFNFEYMKTGADEDAHAVYQAVSKAQFDSGLSFSFSYEIGGMAVSILEEEDWSDEEALLEAINRAIPIYISDLMKIYVSNHDSVDEAALEYGYEGDSVDRARWGWYTELRNMVDSIQSNIEKLIDDSE